jgi:hypothetical protein
MLKRLRQKLWDRLQLRESWLIFFVFGIVLLNYPFLNIFNKPDVIFGLPLLFAYFFVGWGISIFIIFLFTLAIENFGAKITGKRQP